MGRAFFSLLSDPPALLLNRLNLSDTGGYVCNVSYRGDNVTDAGVIVTEAAVELFIAVPQQPPVIRDSQGNLLLATAGPYAEGDTVRLTCAVPAANHDLKLSWRRNGQPLSSNPSNQQTRNSSSATAFSSPRSFECEATGSRPPANITWFLDGLPLDERLSHTRVEGNVTASVLLLPSSERAGKSLECRASNDNLREHRGVLSRYLAVNVSNKPEVSIKLGTGLNASHITEGTDVYMECSVLVASRITDVTWSRDGRELDADLARGTVITSRYLVIRRVTPDHAGSYTCRVTNTRGDAIESTPLLIRVRYSPRCVSDEDLTLSVETDEAVNLTCHVRADPSEGLRYFWLAENSTHGTEATLRSPPYRRQQLPLPHVTESNRLEIVANASIFDTVLACWAENAVGTQERRCRVGNYTDSSFILTCFKPLANVTKTSSTKLRQEQRLRVQVFDARRGNRSERSFWSTDLGPILVNRLRSATDYLVVVRMPPDASFQTYVRTQSPAQTLIGPGDVQGNTRGGRWTLALSVVVLACSLAVTLTALFAIYCAHVRKKKMKRRRKPLDKKTARATPVHRVAKTSTPCTFETTRSTSPRWIRADTADFVGADCQSWTTGSHRQK
ncbi:hypothetical protein MTO96_012258 [Rhipicephalus appendiculatus]